MGKAGKNESVGRMLIAIALPIAVQNLLVTVVNASDAIFLGFLGEGQLAAANLAGQLMQIYNNLIMALCVGATVLAAQYWGLKDRESVKKVLHVTLRISIVSATVFFLACLIVPNLIMKFFTSETDVITYGAIYLRYVSFSYLFMGFSQIYMIIMKNTDKVKESAVYGATAVILNIILDAILVFGLFGAPKMGVAGAALATSIARGVEFALTAIATRRSDNIDFEFKALFAPYTAIRNKYIRYTLPSIVQSESWIVASSITVAIIGHMGSDAVSANAIALVFFNMFCAIAMAVANSAGIIIGNSLGRGDLKQAKSEGDSIMKVSGILGIIFGVVICVSAPVVVTLAGSLSQSAKVYLQWMLVILGIKMFGKLINNTLSNGIFVAGGDVKFLMKLDIINMWCVIVPAGLIAAFLLKLPVIAVYAVINMDEYTKFYVGLKHYYQYNWVKNLTKKEWAEPGKYHRQLEKRIISDMPIGVMMVGSSGKISMVNDNAACGLGYSREELEGTGFTQLFIEDERNNDFVQSILDSISGKEKIIDHTVRYYKDDTCKIMQIRTEFIEEEDAKIGILVMINDITACFAKASAYPEVMVPQN